MSNYVRSLVAFVNFKLCSYLRFNSNHFRFTTKMPTENRLPYLDALTEVKEDGTLKFTVYRKSTHTNQYLHFASNHHIKHKMGVVTTLKRRIETHITDENDKPVEEEMIKHALKNCGHPDWNVDRQPTKHQPAKTDKPYARVVIPYTKGLSERIARTFRKNNIQAIHKPTKTVKNLVCHRAKDKIHNMDKSGILYHVKCKTHNNQYVGETGRAMKVRGYEHKIVNHHDATRSHSVKPKVNETPTAPPPELPTRKSNRLAAKPKNDYKAMHSGSNIILTEGNTAVSKHMANFDHKEEDIDFDIIGFERHRYKRWIKEALAIERFEPDLNDDSSRQFKVPLVYKLLPKTSDPTRGSPSKSTEDFARRSRSKTTERSMESTEATDSVKNRQLNTQQQS